MLKVGKYHNTKQLSDVFQVPNVQYIPKLLLWLNVCALQICVLKLNTP